MEKDNHLMAPEMYYFCLSVAFTLVSIFFVANFLSLRIKNKTLMGQSFKPGTSEYANVKGFASTRNLSIMGAIAILFSGNLAYSVYRLLHLSDREDGRGMLLYGSAFTIFLFVVIFFIIRKQYADPTDKISKK